MDGNYKHETIGDSITKDKQRIDKKFRIKIIT